MPTTQTPAVRPSARAYVAWLVALLAYVLAVFHRASLGVAAVDAQERFSAGASAISLFLVLQLAVYAALQVPVGVALDRFGSRRMRSEEHTSELQSHVNLVCRLLLAKKKAMTDVLTIVKQTTQDTWYQHR